MGIGERTDGGGASPAPTATPHDERRRRPETRRVVERVTGVARGHDGLISAGGEVRVILNNF
jgi:hypothetical protein